MKKLISLFLVLMLTTIIFVSCKTSDETSGKNNNPSGSSKSEGAQTTPSENSESEAQNPPPADLEPNPASDFLYTYDTNLQGIIITSYIGTNSRVRIPVSIKGYNVKSIEEYAFSNKGV